MSETARDSGSYAASDGAAYERFLGRWTTRLAVPFLSFARLPAAGPVLNLGCGTGSLALALAATRSGVMGIDLAAPYIDFARGRPGAAAIDFRRADACALLVGDGELAGVVSQLVLNFLPDPAAAVSEMRRVTRSGGVLAAAVWDFRGGLVYQRIFWDTAAGVDADAGTARDRLFSHPLGTREGLLALSHGAGLNGVDSESLTIRMDFADFADYWNPLLMGQGPLGSYVENLPVERRALICARVRDAFLAGSPDGPRSLTATAWVVRGVVR